MRKTGSKHDEIRTVHADLQKALAARTELSEQMEVLSARIDGMDRHLELLQGSRRPEVESLTDRIVGEVGEVGPTGTSA